MHLAHGRVVVVQVLQDVEGDHEVQAAVGHRQGGRVAAQGGQAALARHARTLGAVLQRRRVPAQVTQHPGVASAGGADVQSATRTQAADLTLQQVAPSGKSPVRVLQLSQLSDLGRLHERSSCQEPRGSVRALG